MSLDTDIAEMIEAGITAHNTLSAKTQGLYESIEYLREVQLDENGDIPINPRTGVVFTEVERRATCDRARTLIEG